MKRSYLPLILATVLVLLTLLASSLLPAAVAQVAQSRPYPGVPNCTIYPVPTDPNDPYPGSGDDCNFLPLLSNNTTE
jgi:hypothetical protein